MRKRISVRLESPIAQFGGNLSMDTVTRYEWHGNGIILLLLSVLVFTIPLAIVYLITNLLKVETKVADAQKLSDFLRSKE